MSVTTSDNFIFNFPSSFVPKQIEEHYKIHLRNFHKPYPTVCEYINSTIKDITVPSLSFPTVSQRNPYGKEIVYRGAISPYDLYSREFNISMKKADYGVPYFIMQDILLYHYINIESPYIDPFTITILDEERRELFKIYLKELVPLGQSDTRLGYNLKSFNEEVYTVSFKFNFIDIEYIPHEAYNNSEDVIEEYSKRIIVHDDSILSSNNDTETDEYIIGK